jgi:hypothetical protein
VSSIVFFERVYVVARSKRVELKDKLLIRDIGTGTKAGELRVNE